MIRQRFFSRRRDPPGSDPSPSFIIWDGMEQALTDYLRLRRSLAHELAEASWLLPAFFAYLDDHGTLTVTNEAALS